MSTKQFTDEFKIEAVSQVVDKGYPLADVAQRLGVSQHSLYLWVRQVRVPAVQREQQASQAEELRRLKAEFRRVT